MDELLSYPGQAYEYINGQYGFVGVIFAGLVLVMSGMGLFIWLDRRK